MNTVIIIDFVCFGISFVDETKLLVNRVKVKILRFLGSQLISYTLSKIY